MNNRIVCCIATGVLLSGCAVTYHVAPLESPPATVRYDHGAGTISLVQHNGALQMTPFGVENGKLVFGVAAFNNSAHPANFGVENIHVVTGENKGLRVFTADDLAREARNKATAESVGLAVVGAAGVAASIAASDQSYHGTYHTPHGSYRYHEHYEDPGVAIAGSALSAGAAGAGIYAVQRSLDATLAGIGQTILQTTTLDPGRSVGGRVVIAKSQSNYYPQDVTVIVDWNGEQYAFPFRVEKQS
ncbi:MAG TPA: hypothetical protein VGK20_06610 [Candidatus Binatia bacterium]